MARKRRSDEIKVAKKQAYEEELRRIEAEKLKREKEEEERRAAEQKRALEQAKQDAIEQAKRDAAEKAAEVAANSAKVLAVVKTALGAGEDAKVRAFAALLTVNGIIWKIMSILEEDSHQKNTKSVYFQVR